MTEQDPKAQLAGLTERQHEVLRLVCEGLIYKNVGAKLDIAVGTVKSHMGNIYIRLGLSDYSDAKRSALLFQVYCPALEEGVFTSDPETQPVEEVVVIVTATSLPATQTSPPPTDVPQPSTNTPTATPRPNTPLGTRLAVGETWIQDGLHLTLQDVELSPESGGTVFLSFTVLNRTGSQLSVSFDIENVTVETNTSERFETFFGADTWQGVIGYGEREVVYFHSRPKYMWLGNFFIPEVNLSFCPVFPKTGGLGDLLSQFAGEAPKINLTRHLVERSL